MQGILMIEPLYHQTVAGNKTMTRRAGAALDEVNDFSMQMNGHQRSPDDCKLLSTVVNPNQTFTASFSKPSVTVPVVCKARYRIGQVLYIKEPYKLEHKYPLAVEENSKIMEPVYAYDKQPHVRKICKWKNKMFMPAEYAREFIRITNIKCERLLDISDEDCIAEGIEKSGAGWADYKSKHGFIWHDLLHKVLTGNTAEKMSFLSLYRVANKMSKKSEISNLWVFAYTFEHLKNYKP